MRLRWSPEASNDLVSIVASIARDSEQAVSDVARTILKRATSLLDIPYKGWAGVRKGTRELLVYPLAYILVYRIDESMIEIVAIYHGAQDRPTIH